jgi:hypothetical protein
VRRRDPRRALERHRRARARVHIIPVPRHEHAEDGRTGSKQVAEVTLPRTELDRIWTPEYLERLAATYWRFITRFSLGLLRVRYTDTSREVVLLVRPFVLLRFRKPEYAIEGTCGRVTWPIERGLLVAPSGRGRGYLRLTVERPSEYDASAQEVTITISSEVVNFYPMLAGWGWFSRIGRRIYDETQLRVHVLVTHAFLRSLANLDLAESTVGALARV